MKGFLKVKPLHREGVEALARHSFHVDEDGNVCHMWDRVLYGSVDVVGALGPLPERQPDSGRRLVANTRHAAHLKFTLPGDIDPEDADRVRRWADVTVVWLTEKCQGELAYAVLHMNDGKPHIHAVLRPIVPESGRISFKKVFSSVLVFEKTCREKYQRALDDAKEETGPPERKPARLTPGQYASLELYRMRRTPYRVDSLLRLPPIGADFQCPACGWPDRTAAVPDPVMMAPVTPGLTARFTPLEHREWGLLVRGGEPRPGDWILTRRQDGCTVECLVSSIIGLVPNTKTGEYRTLTRFSDTRNPKAPVIPLHSQ